MTYLERAKRLAQECHAGQVDKAGYDYIDHVERVADAVKGGLVFSRKWLREQNLPAQDDLRVIYAKGDSMFPFIEDGQVLLVNPHDVTPKSNKVYFLCIDCCFTYSSP